MLPTRDTYAAYLRTKDQRKLKVKGWKQIFQENGKEKKPEQQYSYQTKWTSKEGTLNRDPEGHFIILKGRIHQEDINIVNIDAPNIRAPKYITKILEDFKKDIDRNTIIVGDFKTPLSKIDRSSKQNINKDIVALNNTPDEIDLTDIQREPFIPKKQNAHSFRMHMEDFQRQTT